MQNQDKRRVFRKLVGNENPILPIQAIMLKSDVLGTRPADRNKAQKRINEDLHATNIEGEPDIRGKDQIKKRNAGIHPGPGIAQDAQ